MLKSEMQHQFWITKKIVQRKFSSKEDIHIISSDAELDTKLEVFKSISATNLELSKIIDKYQAIICVLSQEECVFGRFLKEAGKRSKTTCLIITSTGKAVSYCGQQRMCVRAPLLRLQHEVDVFRYQAITDMQNTIAIMEKERTEYRAALEWMKSASAELDPDTGRGLEKFRTAQSHVRHAKRNFDSLTMDSIQKIDLLAAARCNMFSHALVSYMSGLKQFAQMANTTFEAITKALERKPKFDFCILKELELRKANSNINTCKLSDSDKDLSLFFAEDYEDCNESSVSGNNSKEICTELPDDNLVEIYQNSDNGNGDAKDEGQKMTAVNSKSEEMFSRILNTTGLVSPMLAEISPAHPSSNHLKQIKTNSSESGTAFGLTQPLRNEKITSKDFKTNSWIELFADLDPLANLEAFDLKLNGVYKNFQQT